MIFILAFLLVPSVDVALILTDFPAFLTVTTPLLLTVAYFLFELVHFIALLDAVDGVTFAESLIFLPAAILLDIPVTLILLTLTSDASGFDTFVFPPETLPDDPDSKPSTDVV